MHGAVKQCIAFCGHEDHEDSSGHNRTQQDATRCYRTQLNKYSIYITYNLLVLLFFTFSFSSFNMPLSVLDCTINFCVNRIKLPYRYQRMRCQVKMNRNTCKTITRMTPTIMMLRPKKK